MIPFDVIAVIPPSPGSPEAQARESLLILETRLRADHRDHDRVLALTAFVDATDAATYDRRKGGLHALVRESFGGAPPPVSVVAQAPEDGRHVALEAAVPVSTERDVRVSRRACEGLPYTVVEGGGGRHVFGGGIASERGEEDPAAQSRAAFATMGAILGREGLTFGHVVRQWGYIEGMLDLRRADGKSRQGYQAFNDARTLAYDASSFPAGYPAATGIGQAAGGIVLEFVALQAPADVRISPVSNPRQTDAHRYSEGVLIGEALEELPDKSAPKFERAKIVARGESEIVLVSGTAAILGERSVAPGDVEAQTRTTIENIAALTKGRPLSRLRAYVKRAEDIPAVRRVCEDSYGPIPALYVRADVCRDELLVELEGAVLP